MKELSAFLAQAEPGRYQIFQYLGKSSTPSRDTFSYAEEILEPGVVKTEHFHKITDELYIATKGSGILVVNGRDHLLVPGTAILVEPGDRHFVKAAADEQLTVALISCPAFDAGDFHPC